MKNDYEAVAVVISCIVMISNCTLVGWATCSTVLSIAG